MTEFTVLASQLSQLGWSVPQIRLVVGELEANKIALELKAEVRRREADLFRFCAFVIARKGNTEPWKKRPRRGWERSVL